MSKILFLTLGRLNWRLWILALVMTASQPALANTKLDNIHTASTGSNKTALLIKSMNKPPDPQFWGTLNYISPPELGDLGGIAVKEKINSYPDSATPKI